MLEKIKNIVENEIIKNIKYGNVYFKVRKSNETDEIEILYKINSRYDSLEKRNEIFDEINILICKNFNRSELDNILIIYDYFDEID